MNWGGQKNFARSARSVSCALLQMLLAKRTKKISIRFNLAILSHFVCILSNFVRLVPNRGRSRVQMCILMHEICKINQNSGENRRDNELGGSDLTPPVQIFGLNWGG